MTSALIIGAGAIGRGFVAPLLARAGFELDFVDVDSALVERLRRGGSYDTAVATGAEYRFETVSVRRALFPSQMPDVREYEFLFISVGARNYLDYAGTAARARTVFVLENIRDAAARLSGAADSDRIFFGIPDVIVSNTAPGKLIARDPLCVVSELGELILETGSYDIPEIPHVARRDIAALDADWACKFYIHSACHAVAAYLGAMRGHVYIHEAVADPWVGAITEQAMRSVCRAIVRERLVGVEKAESYLMRELMRFRNALLFDPIKRVAREPLRKLDRNDRLMVSLGLVERAGLDSAPFALAINAALVYYAADSDGDLTHPRKSPEDILRSVCGISDPATIRRILFAEPAGDIKNAFFA